MKPGGLAVMSFSNRMFWTKAIKLWTESNEYQRCLVCAAYFKYTGPPRPFSLVPEATADVAVVVAARRVRGPRGV